MWFSPETWEEHGRHGVTADLLSLAVTPTPGSVALPAVRVLAGDVEDAARRAIGTLAAVLRRAADTRRRRRHGDPIRILDADPAPVHVERIAGDLWVDAAGRRAPDRPRPQRPASRRPTPPARR